MSNGSGAAVRVLTVRLLRRGALVLCGVAAAYVAAKAVGYERSYPTAAARAQLLALADNPSVRVLQGKPHAVDSTGAFVAWDGGWFLAVLGAVWSLLTVARLTRGDEESDRAALVLAGPVSARGVLLHQLLVLAGVAGLYGSAVGGTLVLLGESASGSLVLGLGLAGFALLWGAGSAVAVQLVDVRRQGIGIASAVLAMAYAVRVVGNSDDASRRLLWVTPFGWLDDLQPFGDWNRLALGLLLTAPALLIAVAVGLRARRDTGSGLVATRHRRIARLGLLGGTLSFGWRSTRGVLLAWGVAVGAYATLIGALLATVTDLLSKDSGLRRLVSSYGLDEQRLTQSLTAFVSTLLGTAIAVYACWRLGAARSDEESGRLDLVLERPVSRRRWLVGQLVLGLLGIALLATAAALALWSGSALTEGSVTLGEALRGLFNTLPAILLLGSVAVFFLGVRPRWTLSAGVGAAIAAYLLPVLGTALSFPSFVLDISPFQLLARVPAEPYDLTSGAALLLGAVVLGGIGLLAFERRDVVGA